MTDREELERLARETCLRLVQPAHDQARSPTTARPPLDVEVRSTRLEWHETRLRALFEQRMEVWAPSSAVEVYLDETDHVVGFMDETRWGGCAWAPLDAATVVRLAEETGLLEDAYEVETTSPGERGCLVAILQPRARDGLSPRLRVRVNPARRIVISLEPLHGEGT